MSDAVGKVVKWGNGAGVRLTARVLALKAYRAALYAEVV